MINISSEEGKNKFHREYLLSTTLLEAYGLNLIAPILARSFLDTARLLEWGISNFDGVIINTKPRLLEAVKDLYVRTGTVFSNQAFKTFEDTFGKTYSQVPLTSGMREDYWKSYGVWANNLAAKKVVKINDTTRETIRTILENGRKDGKSYGMIAKDLRTLSPIINRQRAWRIARTEIHTASVYSTDESYLNTGVEFEREWHTIIDARTRGNEPKDLFSHVSANGERTSQDGLFIRTGESLRYPGDPSGSAANIINCRCIILYHSVKKTIIAKPQVLHVKLEEQKFIKFKDPKQADEWGMLSAKGYKVTDKQLDALEAYKGSEYEKINGYLRDPNKNASFTKERVQGYVDNLDSLLDKTTNKDNIVVYRGLSDTTQNWKKAMGTVISDPGYTSTTLTREQAEGFIRYAAQRDELNRHDVLLTIKIPKGSKGFYADGIIGTYQNGELEYLLPRNCKLKIIACHTVKVPSGKDIKGVYTIVNAEVISGPVVKELPKDIVEKTSKKIIDWTNKGSYYEAQKQLKEKFNLDQLLSYGDEKNKAEIANEFGNILSGMTKNHTKLIEEISQEKNKLKLLGAVDAKTVSDPVKCFIGVYNRKTKELLCAREAFRNKIEDIITTGKYSATKGYAGTVRHEFGHHYYNSLSFTSKYGWHDLYSSKSKSWWKKGVSAYGATDASEAFAEAFSVYTSPNYSSSTKKLPSKIEDYFKKIFD